MTFVQSLSTLSLAFAMIGGAVLLAPSTSTAGTAKANSGFISIGALKHDAIPCSKRGGTDKNCRVGPPVNPPSRGCSAITRCRG
ncbi:MAG: hypothetical protein JF616_19250 [Fibrobacteres bacterium]|nr:hypothetical protein [Fibrobacterota bacterium]